MQKTAKCNGVVYTYVDDEGLPTDLEQAVGEAEASFVIQGLTGLYDETLDRVLVESTWRPEGDLEYTNPALGTFLWDPVRKDCSASHRQIVYTTNATRFFPAKETHPGMIVLENDKLRQHMALVLKDPEYQCGTNVYKTQLRDIYAVVGGRLNLPELEPKFEDRFFSVVASMHHWFVNNDMSRADVLKKLLDQHCEEEVQRTRASLMQLRNANEVVPYVEGISEPGVRLLVMGDVVYAFQCESVTVEYRPEPNRCTMELPVLYKNSSWFLDTRDKTLVRTARPTPCTRQTPMKFFLEPYWWCIDNITRLCSAAEEPTQMVPTLNDGASNLSIVLDWRYLQNEGYSEEQRENQSKVIDHNVEVKAKVSRFGHELYAPGSSMFLNIFGDEGLYQLKKVLSNRVYQWLYDFLLDPLQRNSNILNAQFFLAAVFGGISFAGFYASRHGMCLYVVWCLFKPAAFLYFNYWFIVLMIWENQRQMDHEEAKKARSPENSSRLMLWIERVAFGRPYTEGAPNTTGDNDDDGAEPTLSPAGDEDGFEKRPPSGGPSAPGEEPSRNVQDDGENYEMLDYNAVREGGNECSATPIRDETPRYVPSPRNSEPQYRMDTRPSESIPAPRMLPPTPPPHLPPSAHLPERSRQVEEATRDYEIEEESYARMPRAALTAQREAELLQEYNSPQKRGWYSQNAPGEWHCHDCVKPVTVHMENHIVRHHATKAHTDSLTFRHGRVALRSDPSPDANIGQVLCEASIAADVNFNKLCHDKFRSGLQRFFGQAYPSEMTFRRKHVDAAYVKAVNGIKAAIGSHSFAVECDGTTDVDQRPVVNVLIRVLDGTQQVPFLANVVYLDEPENSNNIAGAIDNTIIQYELDPLEFRLLVSDSVSFMLKAGRDLKAGRYKNLIHVCCLAHGLHRVCEKIKDMFVRADKLIASCKKIFRKAPKRLALFKSRYPHLDRPPMPVHSRWGTWLTAATYFKNHFEPVKDVVKTLSEMGGQQLSETEDGNQRQKVSQAITDAVATFDDPVTIRELNFIVKYLSFINFTIKELEHGGKRCLSVLQQIELWDDVRARLDAIPEEDDIFAVKEELLVKFDAVATRNEGLSLMRKVNQLLQTPYGHMARNPLRMTLQEAQNLRYSPIVNCDCERFFSFYKGFLNDNRRSFQEENIHKYMLIHFWFNRDDDGAGQQAPAPGAPAPPGDDDDDEEDSSQQPIQSAASNQARLRRLRPANTPTFGLGLAERPTLSQEDQPSSRRRRISADPAPWNPPPGPAPRAEVAPAIHIVGTTAEEKTFLAKCKDLGLANNIVSLLFRDFRKVEDVDVEGLCNVQRGQHRCPRNTPPGECSMSKEQTLPCCHLFAVRRLNNEELLTPAMVFAHRAPARPATPLQPPNNNTPSRPESPGTKLARNLLRLKTSDGRTTPDASAMLSQRTDASDDSDSDGDNDKQREKRTPRDRPASSGATTIQRRSDEDTLPPGQQIRAGKSGAPKTRATNKSPTPSAKTRVTRKSPAPSAQGGSRLRKDVDTAMIKHLTQAGTTVLQLRGPCDKECWLVEVMKRVGEDLKTHIKTTKATFTAIQMIGETFALGLRKGLWAMGDDGKIKLQATKDPHSRPTLSQDDEPSSRRRRISADSAPSNPAPRPAPRAEVAPATNIVVATEDEKKFLAKCKDLGLSNQIASLLLREFRKVEDVDVELCQLQRGQNRCPRNTPPGECSMSKEQTLPCCHLFAVRRFNNEELLIPVMVFAHRAPARPASPLQPPDNDTQSRPESPSTKLARNLLRLRTSDGRTTPEDSSLLSQRTDAHDSNEDNDKPKERRTTRQRPASSGAVSSQPSSGTSGEPSAVTSQPSAGTSGAPRTRASSKQGPAPTSTTGSMLRNRVDSAMTKKIIHAGTAVLQLLGPCDKQRWLGETMNRVGDDLKAHIKTTKATFTAVEMIGEIFALGLRLGLWAVDDNKIKLQRATKSPHSDK